MLLIYENGGKLSFCVFNVDLLSRLAVILILVFFQSVSLLLAEGMLFPLPIPGLVQAPFNYFWIHVFWPIYPFSLSFSHICGSCNLNISSRFTWIHIS